MKLQRKRDQLERMGFEAGIAQLSGRLGIPEQEVKEMGERVLKRDISFNLPAYDSDKETLIDLLTWPTDPSDRDRSSNHPAKVETSHGQLHVANIYCNTANHPCLS